MDRQYLIQQWKTEEDDFQMKGWDFSSIDGRLVSPGTPWEYKSIITSYLKESDNLLDMGTGGGEFLLTLGHPFENTYVTESYMPNYMQCRKKLSPLGITVRQTFEDDILPFEDGKFDFIINRHESFDVTEINRVLRHGGYFITQQIANRSFRELAEILNCRVVQDNPNHAVDVYVKSLAQMGFQVIMKDEAKLPARFYDVGAVIFYAKAIPWEMPRFSVETHLDELLTIQHMIERNGFFQATSGSFIIAALKL